MSKPAVTVRDLHKEFLLPQHKNTSVKQAFVNLGRRNEKKHQRVLDGISFEVQKGDFFGIVGRNGSGKSTLLKILAGVYSPTAGEVALNGKLTPFIELGVGFNPELSGRDNVYLNGALLGFNRKEMAAMYDEIVDFAELREFMDQKLKNYSSGMQVRLAFSIAVKAKNDILIFDEVLAVGDEAFQRKCLDVFEQYKANKQTVILVTHEMETVKKFCNRAILLSEGKIVETGNPYKVANRYSELNQDETDRQTARRNKQSGSAQLKVEVLNAKRQATEKFAMGETLVAKVTLGDLAGLESVGINIFKESGEHITGHNTRYGTLRNKLKKHTTLELEVDLNVARGKYYLLVEAFNKKQEVVEAVLEGPRFSVVPKENLAWSGLVNLPHKWR